MREMSRREESRAALSPGSEDGQKDVSFKMCPSPLEAGRPDLTGKWQFSFEGNVHSWHVNGTVAYTPNGIDETGEQLEIELEDGRETLNGWCLIGTSNDMNMLLWEDAESYDRVVWVRSGHNLEGVLEHMDEDIVINVVDVDTGSLLCELLAERTWLVFDLMEAVRDMIGIHPREQKLTYKGHPLIREDEPLIDVIPSASGDVAIVVCAKAQSPGRHSAPRVSDEAVPRRPSMQDIKEAARCASNT